MTKRKDGRHELSIFLDSLSLWLSGFDVCVKTPKCLHVDVTFYFESEIKATEDEPPCEEFLEILSVRVKDNTVFTDGSGVVLSLDNRVDIVWMLSGHQYERICRLLTETNGTKGRDL